MRQNQGYFTSPRHDIVIRSHSSLIANIIGSSAPELVSGQPQNPKSSPVDSCCEISEPQKNDQTCGFSTLRTSFWANIVYYIYIYIYICIYIYVYIYMYMYIYMWCVCVSMTNPSPDHIKYPTNMIPQSWVIWIWLNAKNEGFVQGFVLNMIGKKYDIVYLCYRLL